MGVGPRQRRQPLHGALARPRGRAGDGPRALGADRQPLAGDRDVHQLRMLGWNTKCRGRSETGNGSPFAFVFGPSISIGKRRDEPVIRIEAIRPA